MDRAKNAQIPQAVEDFREEHGMCAAVFFMLEDETSGGHGHLVVDMDESLPVAVKEFVNFIATMINRFVSAASGIIAVDGLPDEFAND